MKEVIDNREAYLTMLKQRLESAQNRMKLQADKNRKDRQFAVGGQSSTQTSTLHSNISGQPSFPQAGIQILWPL
jgi:hypothetical protein